MNKSTTLQSLNKALGHTGKKEYKPEDFLFELTKLNLESHKDLKRALDEFRSDLLKDRKVSLADVQELKEISVLTSRLLTLQEETKLAIEQRKIEKVIVERPVTEKVEVDLKRSDTDRTEQRSWWEKILPDNFKAATDDIKSELRSWHKKENAIAVKLVTADGQNFYNAFFSAVSGAINTSSLAQDATLNSILAQVTAINASTDTLESLTDGLEGFVDGIEGLLTTLNSLVDGLETDLAAIKTSSEIIDDWDESDRAKVNPIVGQAGVAAGSGASSTTTQRVIAATDSPDVTALQIMDDWDESDRAKVNPIVGQAGVQGGAGTVSANTQRIAVATDANTVKIGDGTDTATVAPTIDSRNGLDTQASSIAVKTFITQNSLNTPSAGNFPLTSGQTFDSGWVDTNGYGAIVLTAVDNTSGGAPFWLEEHWSETGTDDIYDDAATIYLVGGLGGSGEPLLRGAKRTIQMRYVRYIWINDTVNQGTGSPASYNFVSFSAKLVPTPIAFDVNVTNEELSVIGGTDVSIASGQPFIIGGIDNINTPTLMYPALASATGEITVQGNRTSYTGNPLVVAQKLTSTASSGASTVAVAATSTQVFASNTDRLGYSIFNDSSQIVYLKKGTAASSTSFYAILQPYDTLYDDNPGYSGVIHHIAAVAVGNLRCSEW